MIYREVHGFLRPFTQHCEEVRDYMELHKKVSQGSCLDLTVSWWWHFPDIYGEFILGDAHFIDTRWNFLKQVFPVLCASLQSSKHFHLTSFFRHLKHEEMTPCSEKAETCLLSPSMLHLQPPFTYASCSRQVPKTMQEGGVSAVPSTPHQETVEVLASKGWTTPL